MPETRTKRSYTLEQALPYLYIVLSAIGFICAFVITYEKMQLLQNPAYHPPCSINPIISCGSVMESKQSNVFGFTNPLIGLAFFPMVLTAGVLMLGGAKLKRWAWLTLQAGTLFGVLFVHWLFFQSAYRIQALCPYCMVVWTMTIALFWYTLLYNLRNGAIAVPAKLRGFTGFLQRHHADILVLWYLVIAALIGQHFWYFWKTLI